MDINSKEFLDYIQDNFDKFTSDFNLEELKPLTQPSIISKGGTRVIDLEKLDPKSIEKYLWLHPVIPSGIDKKANRMVRRGYTITPSSNDPLALASAKYCDRILNNSGKTLFLKRWISDGFGYGNGFWTLVPNKAQDEILKLNPEHPVYFGASFYPDDYPDYDRRGQYKINSKTKDVVYFTQLRPKKTNPDKYEPFGDEIPANMVAHLIFDRWGDEPLGISLVQYVFLTIKYLLNLEEAAAERMWRDGFTQKKVTTEITNDRDLKLLAKNIHAINSRDAIILPKGTDVTNLIPGDSNFPEFHKVYIQLLAIRLGLPLPLLTMSGTETNKSTTSSQREDIMADFFMDEEIVKQTIEEQIFKSACEYKWGKGFEHIPYFDFNEMPEDEDTKVNRFFKVSQSINNVTNAINNLVSSGIDLEDDMILNLLNYLDERVIDSHTARPNRNITLINNIENGTEKKVRTVKRTKRETEKTSIGSELQESNKVL